MGLWAFWGWDAPLSTDLMPPVRADRIKTPCSSCSSFGTKDLRLPYADPRGFPPDSLETRLILAHDHCQAHIPPGSFLSPSICLRRDDDREEDAKEKRGAVLSAKSPSKLE